MSINHVWSYIEGASLECPKAEEAATTKTNVIPEDDVGISYLSVKPKGKNAEIVVEVHNNNQQAPKVELKVTVSKEGTVVKEFRESMQALTKEMKTFELENLDEGNYDVRAEIVVSLEECEYCFNNLPGDDVVETSFSIGKGGVEKCEPYSTERLVEFMEASGESESNIKKYSNMVKFKAYLMKDGFSEDFKKDFVEAMLKGFLNAPTWFSENVDGSNAEGVPKWYDLFKERVRFVSKYGDEPMLQVEPGLYEVTIAMEFDGGWKILKEDNSLNVDVKVKLEKLKNAEPDLPFYYIPIDATLGLEDGRVGYGTNFEGDIVLIGSGLGGGIGKIETVNIPNSTPVAKVKVEYNKSFKSINVYNRGSVLTVTRNKIVFSPNVPTPIMLEVKNKSGDAWAFYSVSINNSTAQSNVGPEMLLWTGIGIGCKDFMGREVIEAYDETPDVHALDTMAIKCAKVAANKEIAYGLEWCGKLAFSGSVFLKTIVFTPQGSISKMQIESASDDATIYAPNGQQGKIGIELNGVPGTGNIQSIMDVLDLVNGNWVCISGTGVRTEFVWNPKKIYEEASELKSKEEEAINKCIR